MTDVTKEDFKELKEAVTEMTRAVTTLIAKEEQREAELKRLSDCLKQSESRLYKLETEKIPELMRVIASNKQIILLTTVVIGSLMTGAISMFFKFAGQMAS